MLAGSPPYGGTAVLPAARRSEGDPAQLERQWLSAAQPLTFGGIGNFKDRRSHPLVPVQVRLGGGEVECPDGCDPVARQHRQRKVFRACAAKGHARKLHEEVLIASDLA
jgi:hypothetical protein